MKSDERRNLIIQTLSKCNSSISATSLANNFSVTRQIIVADIALLRASGYQIIADNKGYKLITANNDLIKRIAVQHSKDYVNNEFYAIVDNGGKVLDVIIEHPIYGKISVELNITSRYETVEFVKKLRIEQAKSLLESRRYTVGQIAQMTGFSDEKYFSLVFRKTVGCPPSRYVK